MGGGGTHLSRSQQPQSPSSLRHRFHLRGERCHVTQGSSHTSHGGHRARQSLLPFSGVECLSRVLNWHFLRGMALPNRARPALASTLSYHHDSSSFFHTIEWIIFVRMYFWDRYCVSIDPCVSLSPNYTAFFLIIFFIAI